MKIILSIQIIWLLTNHNYFWYVPIGPASPAGPTGPAGPISPCVPNTTQKTWEKHEKQRSLSLLFNLNTECESFGSMPCQQIFSISTYPVDRRGQECQQHLYGGANELEEISRGILLSSSKQIKWTNTGKLRVKFDWMNCGTLTHSLALWLHATQTQAK